MSRIFLVSALFLLLTTETLAAVTIHEVAWMGSASSANHEWIELHNSGSEAISVAGWTLRDGMNLLITLAGSIPAGAYAVLERTSEDSAPGTAFLMYTGAMVNTGATLTLRDATEGIVDQVAGGADWQSIGGDNATKETAQYTSAGWVTDTPTPGAQNRNGRVVPEAETDEEVVSTTTTAATTSGSNSTRNRGSGGSSTVRLNNPETVMTLSADIPSVAYVHQVVPFVVTARGNYEAPESMVRYSWNFGDRHAKEGKRVEHSYEYPGQYVVTVHGKNRGTEQTVRQHITVLPVTFSLTKNAQGDIQIHNDAQYDVDISGYRLRGDDVFVFPPRTVMLARGTITIPAEVVGGTDQLVAFYDAKQHLVTSTFASLSPATINKPLADTAGETPRPTAAFRAEPVSTFGFGVEQALAAESETLASETIVIEAAESGVPAAPRSTRFWYLTFIGFFALLFLAVLAVPRTNKA